MKLLFILSILSLASICQINSKRVVCYYTNWALYRSGDGQFSISDIDPNICTHIIYSFAAVRGNTLTTIEANDLEMYKKITGLKKENPDLKVLLAVGGWNHPAQPFTQMVSTEASQNEFVENSCKFIKEHGFDGFDLDWEYPADRGSPPQDRARFTQLVKKLSVKYRSEGLLLTAATAAAPEQYDKCYEAELCQHLDFINLMAYDYGGHWESTATHNSPMTAQRKTVEHLLRKPGCTPDKLVLGMGAYGRTHRLSNPAVNGIGAPTRPNTGIAGEYTQESGFLSYYEVCKKLEEGWQRGWSNEHQVPYAYSGSDWVGYDDTQSIAIKSQYVNDMNLGGAMFWAMDLDDFRGTSCGQGKYPLINTAKDIVNGGSSSVTRTTIPSTTGTTTPGTTTTTTPIPASQTPTASLYCLNSLAKQTYANVTDNCRSYYECLTAPSGRQLTVSRSCPTSFIYVETEMTCVRESEITNLPAKCSTKLALPVAPSTSANCWDPTLIITESRCRFYTDCSTKSRYECPPNSSFDRNIRKCVPSQQIQCWW